MAKYKDKMASPSSLEDGDTAVLSNIKQEIDEWHMTETKTDGPARKNGASENTATKSAMQGLARQDGNISRTKVKQEPRSPESETQTAVNTQSSVCLKVEIETIETLTAPNSHNDSWLDQEPQAPEAQTAVTSLCTVLNGNRRGAKRPRNTKDNRKVPKRKNCSVAEKLSAIERCKNGEPRMSVCRDFGVSESTVRGWLGAEEKLRSFIDKFDKTVGPKRCRTTGSHDHKLDAAVFQWFVREQEKGTPISSAAIKAQAVKFRSKIHGENNPTSAPSFGWVQRFKARHAIDAVIVDGEFQSALDMERAREQFPELLRTVLEQHGLKAEQVYNADETGLYYKAIPREILESRSDKTKHEGYRENQERITLLLCTNATGNHKLKPLMIGEPRNPLCFRYVNMNNLPVKYCSSKYCWTTGVLFQNWFYEDFVPAVRCHLRERNMDEKAVLILDNCPAHLPADTLRTQDGKIFVYYLPRNVPSKAQPMVQGIISNFKMNYRCELMQKVMQEYRNVMKGLKHITVKEAAFLAGKSWADVKRESVQRVWKKALGPAFHAVQVQDSEATPQGDTASLDDWLSSDDDEDEDAKPFLGFSEEETRQARETYLRCCAREGIQPRNGWIDDIAEEEDQEDVAAPLSDDDIVDALVNNTVDDEDDDDDDDSDDSDDDKDDDTVNNSDSGDTCSPRVTAREAVAGLEKALLWFEGQETDTDQLFQLRQFLATARAAASDTKRQLRSSKGSLSKST